LQRALDAPSSLRAKFPPDETIYRAAGSEGDRVVILGMSVSSFTLLHVVLSLIAIVAGAVVLVGMLGSRRRGGWAALFLATAVLTSATGFLFPQDRLLPSHIVAIISLIALALAIVALYAGRLSGPWRWLYVSGAGIALYLDVFVAIAQAFMKLPVLQMLAPTQSEPPFLVAQLVVLAMFVVLGLLAARRFRPERAAPA
jgi:hypothetical protein